MSTSWVIEVTGVTEIDEGNHIRLDCEMFHITCTPTPQPDMSLVIGSSKLPRLHLLFPEQGNMRDRGKPLLAGRSG